MNRDFWRARRVFLTGHSGFKGSWLSEWFIMTGVAHYGYSLPADIGLSGKLIVDLTAYEPDILIHMAAQSLVKTGYEYPRETFSTNVQGTVNVLEAVRHCPSLRAILIVTTDKVYKAWAAGPHKEFDALGGHDPYSASKAAAELAATAYSDSFKLPIATCRAGNVIGGGDWASYRLIPNIVRALQTNTPLLIPYPAAVRPWQHVLDCLHGYLLLAERLYQDGSFSGAYNFGGDDNSWTVLDVVKAFKCPYVLSEEEFVEREILTLDSTKARTLLGWAPKLSVAEAIEWTKQGYFNEKATPRNQIERWEKL